MGSLPIEGRFVGGKDYAPLNEASLRRLVAGVQACRTLLGGEPDRWRVREVGDGNLNLVFIVENGSTGVVVKQALPYVRLVGESWPLPLDRAHFECEALKIQASHARGLTPEIYHFAPRQAAIVMEYLTPHIILRKGLIRRIRYPLLAGHLSAFLAETLFGTSDLAMPAHTKKAAQALFCENTALSKITEDLVFTDPYRIAPLNRWTAPQLDGIAAEFRADAGLKVAVQELKWAFLCRGEALVHGDLHTGSVMVTPEDTRVIDPEFAFFGPMGFDIGAVLANLMLSYLAQAGHAGSREAIESYRGFLLETLAGVWRGFESRFLTLWRDHAAGDAFTAELFADSAAREALEAFRRVTLARIFSDSIGFAGAKMVRRILGLAHVEDLETIADPDIRAGCERRALRLARHLMLNRAAIGTTDRLCSLVVEASLEAA